MYLSSLDLKKYGQTSQQGCLIHPKVMNWKIDPIFIMVFNDLTKEFNFSVI